MGSSGSRGPVYRQATVNLAGVEISPMENVLLRHFTRNDLAWRKVFADAGLRTIKERASQKA